jgi:hypothetical protein
MLNPWIKKSWVRVILLFLGTWLLSISVFAASPIDYENNPKFEEAYRIKVWNSAGGTIEVSRDSGKSWTEVGKVIYPVGKTNPDSYKAARWVPDGKVAATAVNAIHIKTATASSDGSGIIFSLLPKEFAKKPSQYRSYFSADASLYTSIPAGESIFGGEFSPFVGNIVLVSQLGKPVIPLPKDYVPQLNDKIYILVDRPIDYPKEMVFENQFGGAVTISYVGGIEKRIAEVLRPVVGVGRFEGTKYTSLGRIRANHAGVIDVSTSDLGKIGGFQIVPSHHGSELIGAKELTQWMVIGPLGDENDSLEGKAPFFKYFIKPAYGQNDIEEEDWENRMLDHFLVEVKYKGEEAWKPMPLFQFNDYDLTGDVPSWANNALSNVSSFRILFPAE